MFAAWKNGETAKRAAQLADTIPFNPASFQSEPAAT